LAAEILGDGCDMRNIRNLIAQIRHHRAKIIMIRNLYHVLRERPIHGISAEFGFGTAYG